MNPGVDSCDAFPDGIPALIFLQGQSHREPIPNDNGIQFTPLPTVEQSEQAYAEYGRKRKELFT